MDHRRVLVAIANPITATVTVPILSAVFAQAVVFFCQRRRPEEFLSIKGIFASSDRGWTNIPILWRAWLHTPCYEDTEQSVHGRKSSKLLLLGAHRLIILGATHQPLYQILVDYEDTVLVTGRGTSYYNRTWMRATSQEDSKLLGVDAEPAEAGAIPQFYIRSLIASELATILITENQPDLGMNSVTAEAPLISQLGNPLQTLEQVFATVLSFHENSAAMLRISPRIYT